ncbi:sulfurtransferase TusA family protein [Paracoccus aestuariivivens]|uniref:Sulfurtransferase TusA family protein n=1 Tax=Paracoccus aestuariivivens TaxID=1820333 RepID=A0A6L6J7Y1_9RHOB|nr:sulfurtransferase TusA family protein [Paracoccus aestuariivivens]MTH76727.1 sulfurtransferase TusA family protein [Paracoccus aestuariivivens]
MTETIDARGLICPLPVLRLRKRLIALEAGSQVILLATDRAAVIDVPHFCHEAGHRLIAATALPDGATEYLVERGPDA